MKKLIILFFVLVLHASSGLGKPIVMVMEFKGTIDSRTLRYAKLAFEYADDIGANYILVEMDTYGGTLNDAEDIIDIILDVKVPIWIWINKDAASAGALISIACDSIYMAEGASIGAATVVVSDGSVASEKYQSYMRSIMRSTAEANHRDPQIAEGMVDQDIVIKNITKAGKVITFTVSEAIQHGYCEAKVGSLKELLERNGVVDYNMMVFQLDTTEKIISFFINPFISSLLILLILAGLYFELQSPGIGFPLITAIVALILYLVPYYLNGLAENWEIITFFVGLLLVFAEVFVIPGLGVAGVSGVVLIIGSMVFIMLDNDVFNFDMVDSADITAVLFSVFGALIGGIILFFFGITRFNRIGLFKRLSLMDTQKSSQGYTSNFHTEQLIGKTGITHTVLRPSGKVIIQDQLYDAFSYGDYLEKGETVKVVAIEGSTLKIKRSSNEDTRHYSSTV